MALLFVVIIDEIIHVVQVFLLLTSSNALLIIPDAGDIVRPRLGWASYVKIIF
jgi:hypothetical protein